MNELVAIEEKAFKTNRRIYLLKLEASTRFLELGKKLKQG